MLLDGCRVQWEDRLSFIGTISIVTAPISSVDCSPKVTRLGGLLGLLGLLLELIVGDLDVQLRSFRQTNRIGGSNSVPAS